MRTLCALLVCAHGRLLLEEDPAMQVADDPPPRPSLLAGLLPLRAAAALQVSPALPAVRGGPAWPPPRALLPLLAEGASATRDEAEVVTPGTTADSAELAGETQLDGIVKSTSELDDDVLAAMGPAMDLTVVPESAKEVDGSEEDLPAAEAPPAAVDPTLVQESAKEVLSSLGGLAWTLAKAAGSVAAPAAADAVKAGANAAKAGANAASSALDQAVQKAAEKPAPRLAAPRRAVEQVKEPSAAELEAQRTLQRSLNKFSRPSTSSLTVAAAQERRKQERRMKEAQRKQERLMKGAQRKRERTTKEAQQAQAALRTPAPTPAPGSPEAQAAAVRAAYELRVQKEKAEKDLQAKGQTQATTPRRTQRVVRPSVPTRTKLTRAKPTRAPKPTRPPTPAPDSPEAQAAALRAAYDLRVQKQKAGEAPSKPLSAAATAAQERRKQEALRRAQAAFIKETERKEAAAQRAQKEAQRKAAAAEKKRQAEAVAAQKKRQAAAAAEKKREDQQRQRQLKLAKQKQSSAAKPGRALTTKSAQSAQSAKAEEEESWWSSLFSPRAKESPAATKPARAPSRKPPLPKKRGPSAAATAGSAKSSAPAWGSLFGSKGKQGKPRGSGGKMLLRDDSPDEDGDWDLDELLEMMGDAEGTSGDDPGEEGPEGPAVAAQSDADANAPPGTLGGELPDER